MLLNRVQDCNQLSVLVVWLLIKYNFGIIVGLVDAYALADDTLKEIDALATLLSNKFNEINMSGLNLDGKKGGQMFTSQVWRQENPLTDQTLVAIFVTDPDKITSDDYNVIYDEKSDLWTLSASTLKTSVTGGNS